MNPEWLMYVGAFSFGAIIGSFLSVCIFRLPQGASIVSPGSACPKCSQSIRPYDNVPIFSFFLLKGRCRNCAASIPYRYPIVEVTNGFGYVVLLGQFGLGWPVFVYAVFFSTLLTITWIDFDHQIIPDVISLPGIGIGFLSSSLLLPVEWLNSLLGILVGGGVLLAMAWVSPFLFGKEGLGGGDIKLLAMIGAFLGWKHALLTLLLASSIGALVGVCLMAVKKLSRGQYMPFGPYLALGAVVSLLYGPKILAWYFGALY